MVGQYGGGAFVLIYLFFLVILGIPVMTMEFAMGRAGQRSPARLYQQLEPKGSKCTCTAMLPWPATIF